jgi:hypothetical protein
VKIPVASYTMLNDFDNCPHKGFRKHVVKDLQWTGPASQQGMSGVEIHKAMAMAISRGRQLPKEIEKYTPLVAVLMGRNALTELPVAIRRDGEPCGFYDDNVACRGYADVVVIDNTTAVMFDWKTGKKREDPTELKLHAMMLRARYSNLTRILGHYVWLNNVDLGLPALGKQHDLSDIGHTYREMEQQLDEIEHMLTHNDFPKQPNPLCAWCPVMDCENNAVLQRQTKEAARG